MCSLPSGVEASLGFAFPCNAHDAQLASPCHDESGGHCLGRREGCVDGLLKLLQRGLSLGKPFDHSGLVGRALDHRSLRVQAQKAF